MAQSPFTRSLWRLLHARNVRRQSTQYKKTAHLRLLTLEDRTVLSTASTNITGLIFTDTNRNGIFDRGERVLPGAIVTLTGQVNGQPVSQTGELLSRNVQISVIANAQGGYTFQNVLPGTYRVFVGPQPNVIGTPSRQITISENPPPGQTNLPIQTANLGVLGVRGRLLSLRQFLNTTSTGIVAVNPVGSGLSSVNARSNDRPTVVGSGIPAQSVSTSTNTTTIDLAAFFTDANMTNSLVRFETNEGSFHVELFDSQAPQTVANFFNYINAGLYNNTIFHRQPVGFVLQGGGYKVNPGTLLDPLTLTKVPTFGTVLNEFSPTRSNTENTLAMAKVSGDPNSATSEFFINLANNASNLDNQNGGFTVFGRLEGIVSPTNVNRVVVNRFTNSPYIRNSVKLLPSDPVASDDVPLKNYAGPTSGFPGNATLDNFALVRQAVVVRRNEYLRYTARVTSGADLFTGLGAGGSIPLNAQSNNRLKLDFASGATGEATIEVTATDRMGASVTTTFTVFRTGTEESTVALVSDTPISQAGDPVKFTATVTGGSGTPTGKVNFLLGNTVLNATPVNLDASGVAEFTTAAGQLRASTSAQTIRAVYLGDGTYARSEATVSQTVNQATTTTTVTSSNTNATFGQSVTLTATVTNSNEGTNGLGKPTGIVTFYQGDVAPANRLGAAVLNSNGQAILTTTALKPGTNTTIRAVYEEANNTDFATSEGTLTNQTVKVNTTISLRATRSSVPRGQSVTFTATVASAVAGVGTPTGNVVFRDVTNPSSPQDLGTVALSSGVATFAFTPAVNYPTGVRKIVAVYQGDDNFKTITSTPFSLTVT
jgi:cyclophilin family peptidyl-prolyl cis-trans isomerase